MGLALVLLPLILPVLLLAGLVVRLDSPGPAFFRQVRIGRGRKPFTMLKLRTMTVDTEQRASHEVSAARITRAGLWMRRSKIDELPQVFSVLRGDMSFVGPRPCLPNQAELIAEREARGVFTVRPGITGLSQVQGVDMSTPAKLAELDAKYVSSRTMSTDLHLLLATALGRGSGDAVNAPSEDKRG